MKTGTISTKTSLGLLLTVVLPLVLAATIALGQQESATTSAPVPGVVPTSPQLQPSVFPPTASIARVVPGRTARSSTWQQDGGNKDFIHIGAGETHVLLDVDGPGMISHIYMTMVEPDVLDFRDAILRMYWDGETTPSVEVPLGDFFCIGNCAVKHFSSAMVAVNPGGEGVRELSNNGYNCYFPMPFASHARIEIVNQSDRYLGGGYAGLWYHVEYDRYDAPLPDDLGRFHAQWRHRTPDTSREEKFDFGGSKPHLNTTGKDNFVMLEAQGEGQVVGLFFQVDNARGGWYGEGDDMIFIDGDTWPPSLHGTGTEEVFGGGACPKVEYAGIYSGFLLIENRYGQDFAGNNAMYRWYIQDPIRFRKSIRMTIERNHDNMGNNDYASVAYWFQKEPHAPFPAMQPVKERRPKFPESFYSAHDKALKLYKDFVQARLESRYGKQQPGEMQDRYLMYMVSEYMDIACRLMHAKDYDGADQLFARVLDAWQKRGKQ